MACMNFNLRVVWTSYLTSCASIGGPKHSDWLRLRLMEQSQEILLGYAILVSSEYGYHGNRRIARLISNKT